MSRQPFGTPITAERPLLVSIKDATRLTGLGRSYLYELMRSGEIAFVRCGKRRLIPFTALTAWAERLAGQSEAAR